MSLSPKLKKLLLVLGFLVIAFLLGYGLYWLFFRKAPVPEARVNINGVMVPISQLPNINIAPPRVVENVNLALPKVDSIARGDKTASSLIVDQTTQNAALGQDGLLRFYDRESGKFYRVAPDGTLSEMTDDIFKEADKVTWSNDANKAILEFPDGSNISYDFATKKQYTLPKEATEFSFSPADTEIAFKYLPSREDERWLGVSNFDGSGVQGIEPLGANQDKVQVQWSPSGIAIATFNEYTSGSEQRVFPIGLKGENFKQMYVEGRVFEYKWTTDGQRMVYNVYNSASDYKPQLYVVDAYGDDIGKNRQNLGLNTWVEKCSYNRSGSALYCAVPQELPRGAGIAPGIADETPDDIYKIDLQTGVKTKIAEPTDALGSTNYTIDQLMLSADEKYLYFVDKAEGKIRAIQLK